MSLGTASAPITVTAIQVGDLLAEGERMPVCVHLVDHPRVLRVVALSGGFARPEACAELAKNRGMIASFSRALLEDLRHGTSDEEFNRSLGDAIDEIHRASTEKVPA